MWNVILELAFSKLGFPSGPVGKEPDCLWGRHKRHGFNSWVRKIPWRRKWQPCILTWEIPWIKGPGGLMNSGTWLSTHGEEVKQERRKGLGGQLKISAKFLCGQWETRYSWEFSYGEKKLSFCVPFLLRTFSFTPQNSLDSALDITIPIYLWKLGLRVNLSMRPTQLCKFHLGF